MSHHLAVLASIITLVFVQGAAAVEPAIKCEATKLKEVGKYANCRMKADSKAVKKNEDPDYSKCNDKFDTKWGKAETKAGGACPSNNDNNDVQLAVDTCMGEIAASLAQAPENVPCDAVAQDCPGGEGCYPILSDPYSAVCASPALAGGSGLQGEACEFLNACAVGYGCVLVDDPVNPIGLECAYLCDADNPDVNLACSDGPGPAFECRQLNGFYANITTAPSNLGICVDPLEWPAP